MKILVVDDNRADLELIEYTLRGMGQCFLAHSREELVDLLQAWPFDVAVIDYWLPELGWIDSMRLIHERYPKTPIVVLSGATLEHMRGYQVVHDGADDFVLKDRLDTLPHVLRRVVIHRLAKTEREISLGKLNNGYDANGVRDVIEVRAGPDYPPKEEVE